MSKFYWNRTPRCFFSVSDKGGSTSTPNSSQTYDFYSTFELQETCGNLAATKLGSWDNRGLKQRRSWAEVIFCTLWPLFGTNSWANRLYSWFATTWQGGHIGGQCYRNFARIIYIRTGFFVSVNLVSGMSRLCEG